MREGCNRSHRSSIDPFGFTRRLSMAQPVHPLTIGVPVGVPTCFSFSLGSMIRSILTTVVECLLSLTIRASFPSTAQVLSLDYLLCSERLGDVSTDNLCPKSTPTPDIYRKSQPNFFLAKRCLLANHMDTCHSYLFGQKLSNHLAPLSTLSTYAKACHPSLDPTMIEPWFDIQTYSTMVQ